MSPNKHSCKKEVVSGVVTTCIGLFMTQWNGAKSVGLLPHYRLVLRTQITWKNGTNCCKSKSDTIWIQTLFGGYNEGQNFLYVS